MKFIKNAYFDKDRFNRTILRFEADDDFNMVSNRLIIKYCGRLPKRKLVRKKWFNLALIRCLTERMHEN